MSKDQFSHGNRRSSGGVQYDDTARAGVFYIDIIHSNTGPGHQSKIGTSVQKFGSNLGSGADDQTIVSGKACGQFLLRDFVGIHRMPGFFQDFFAGFVDSVVGQYFHVSRGGWFG